MKPGWLAVTAVGLSLFTASACTPRKRLPAGSGRVVSADSGIPVPGAVVHQSIRVTCRRLNPVDGQSRSVIGPFRESRSGPDGWFRLPSLTLSPSALCRVETSTVVFAPGYFPTRIQGAPGRIRLQPMRRYLDFLPWRMPREYLSRIGSDYARRRDLHRRLRTYQSMAGFRRLRSESRLLKPALDRLAARDLDFLDAPGVFWRNDSTRVDRMIAFGRRGDLLLHDTGSHRWRLLSVQGQTRGSAPALPPDSAVLPNRIPRDGGFVFALGGMLYIPRRPGAPAAPFSSRRYRILTCRSGNASAVAPWGSGAAAIEADGRCLCLYARAKSSSDPGRTVPVRQLGADFRKARFVFLRADSLGRLLALVREHARWWIVDVPPPGSGKPLSPPVLLPVGGALTAAALGDGLLVAHEDGGLTRMAISRRGRLSISLDRDFSLFSRGVLPAAAVALAPAADYRFAAACGGGRVFRFGLFGIPDQRVRLADSGKGAPAVPKEYRPAAPPAMNVSLPRIHPHGGAGRQKLKKEKTPGKGR